ncbi:MAG: class I SAM-dependent methyltransferase [Gemmatimonadota bacterium]
MKAIHAGRLAEAARALLGMEDGLLDTEAVALAHAAVDACTSISAYVRDERTTLLEVFAEAGVEAHALPDKADADRMQIHRISVRLDPGHLARGLRVAEERGYMNPVRHTGGAWACFRRVRHEVVLTRTDAVATRLRIVWGEESDRRIARWLRPFHPTDADLALADLPAGLWPLYYGIRPVRVLANRASRRPPPPRPWPFLGTPVGLVPALLDAARVGPEDHLVDLGCGDGRILVAAARHTGCRCLGIENDPVLAALARKRVAEASLQDRVSVVEGDAHGVALAEASVVFLFLPMPGIPGLVARLTGQLRRGSRILVHEQAPLDPNLHPAISRPLFTDSGITVAHLWRT